MCFCIVVKRLFKKAGICIIFIGCLLLLQLKIFISFFMLQKSILLSCEAQVASLLADVFQNYKSLDENSPTGLMDMSGPVTETAAPALAPAVKVYTLLHDILTQDAQTILRNYLEVSNSLSSYVSTNC